MTDATALPSVRQSAGYQSLLRLAQADGIDTASIGDLLWLTNAHPHFAGHGQVFEHLHTLLSLPIFAPHSLTWARHWPHVLSDLRAVLEWLKRRADQIADQPGLEEWHARPTGKRGNPLVGRNVDRHPIAAAIWCALSTPIQI